MRVVLAILMVVSEQTAVVGNHVATPSAQVLVSERGQNHTCLLHSVIVNRRLEVHLILLFHRVLMRKGGSGAVATLLNGGDSASAARHGARAEAALARLLLLDCHGVAI